MLQLGDVVLDTTSRTVTRAGELCELTGREYALAEMFVRRPNDVLTRDYIYEHLFDENEDSLSNMLDVYIYKLRKKLGKDFISTLRGQGYIARSHSPG